MKMQSDKTLGFIQNAPRYLFFTGKGGVGKTTLSCATAVALADLGRHVLLVSTDPASNLAHVFESEIGEQTPTPIEAVPNLYALNIDPEAAAQAYRDRIVEPARGVMPADVVRRMEEELSGACTTEIAAFDEFTALLTDTDATGGYDHIVFDTAPTGHTLRLLSLPSAWSDFLDSNQSGASCLGPLAGLQKQRLQYQTAVETLADRARTTIVLVSRPQSAALKEAERTCNELSELGITNQRLALNGMMPASVSNDHLAQAMHKRDRQALENMPDSIRSLPQDKIELLPINLTGVVSLRALVEGDYESALDEKPGESLPPVTAPSLSDLVHEIEADGHGLVMVLGKGGVGKTTIAAAIAVGLAERGHAVHLTTTDPAAHLADTVVNEIEHLQVGRIDPRIETERYRQHVLETKGKRLDASGLALLEEDLRSPCTEEIAVFQAFSKVIREAQEKFVVVDTAPTGHTLLLLDATGSYHRDIMRHAKEGLKVVTPMMRLQDPEQTKMLIVTLPETTPVLEAAALQEDLRRAGIQPWAWVINASLAVAGSSDRLLAARAQFEIAEIHKVQNELSHRVAITPWLAEEPTGEQGLRRLLQSVPKPDSAERVK